MEALLGEGRNELSHRLGLRAATALANRMNNPLKASDVYTMVKKVYDYRSAVVHGASADSKRMIVIQDVTYDAAHLAVSLLRELLTDALERGWNTQTLDELLLASLGHGF